MKKILNKRGQNTVEYLLILAAVVAVAIGVGKLLKGGLNGATNQVMGKITAAIDSN